MKLFLIKFIQFHISRNVFGWDEDFMAGPKAWENNDIKSR